MTPLAGTDPTLVAFGYGVTFALLAVPCWGALRLIVAHYRQRRAERDPVRAFETTTADLGKACGWGPR